MDARTTSLFDALAHPGAALLLALADGEATEGQLLSGLAGTSQPTVNRRLGDLERLGVIEREAGRPKAPGRAWRLVEPVAPRRSSSLRSTSRTSSRSPNSVGVRPRSAGSSERGRHGSGCARLTGANRTDNGTGAVQYVPGPDPETPRLRGFCLVGDPGLEPGTSSLSEKRSNRLS